MTVAKPCPEAPGPLEDDARRFDDCFESLAQRRAFREYLSGLLLPRDRNKTLTGLAGTEPVRGAQHPVAQRLQYVLSEADLPKSHRGHESGEPLPLVRHGAAGAALALVLVDDHDLLGGPAQPVRAFGQGLLAPGALRVTLDLGGAGLADGDERLPRQVAGHHLRVR